MPELPEVETIAASLRTGTDDGPALPGRRIARADIFWNRTVAAPSPEEFQERVRGQSVSEVGRRGKFLILQLSDDFLLLHLRMSGDVLFGEGEEPLGKYARLVLYFEGGWQLCFDDARKFGRVWLVRDPEEVVGDLGPEPFDPALTYERFYDLMQGRKRQVKPLLLDQNFLAGLGNIYADEALHAAKVHPLTRSHLLERNQTTRLLKAIRGALANGIRNNGASIDWVYRGGDFQNHFRVYQRADEPCPRCGTPIQRIVVGQRGTHICPACQVPITSHRP